MNALHNAYAEIRATHPEGSAGVETELNGPGGALLALLSAITMNLMEVMTKKAGVPPILAAKAITGAVKTGLEMANKQ